MTKKREKINILLPTSLNVSNDQINCQCRSVSDIITRNFWSPWLWIYYLANRLFRVIVRKSWNFFNKLLCSYIFFMAMRASIENRKKGYQNRQTRRRKQVARLVCRERLQDIRNTAKRESQIKSRQTNREKARRNRTCDRLQTILHSI